MRLQPSDPDIETIVGRIKSSDLDLQPEFQRGEVWSVGKKRRLIDSILRGWHIPPIHVVVDRDGRQVVLDGQQRLVSIRDFVNGAFDIDGAIEPSDPIIQRLHGCHYESLPREVRRAFDQFTIRVFRVTDYSPEEPGELFYRLNQMTYLTAAEQRNAFFGPVRQQVKELVQLLQLKEDNHLLGFSNRRMAYDDIIAKVLCTLEAGTLSKKLTASDISNRFRKAEPFDASHFSCAVRSINTLNAIAESAFLTKNRFNKATLFSWIIFISLFEKRHGNARDVLHDFHNFFNNERDNVQFGYGISVVDGQVRLSELDKKDRHTALMRIYIDRSSSRVSDVSSVVLRDFILWAFFIDYKNGESFARDILSSEKFRILVSSRRSIHPPFLESGSERIADLNVWGSLH
ncbi:DUF262 domain-containing protein [Methylocystis rosea]|uniref:DUF262 domain-containing protein n=1 Tax=Methylocystis rosea TaxID=173366 RepID=UPI0018A6C659|nr:DUF262 domain-containing protein [Methylocystis rosea]